MTSDDIRTRMWKAMSDSPNVMLSLDASRQHAEPMHAVLDEKADSEFWFYTTHTNRIAEGGSAMAQFSSKGHDVFACISGKLVEETRREIIDKYWSKPVSSWFEGGKDDPNMKMMRFELKDAEIWIAEPGFKGVFKLMTGKKVDPNEMGEHDKVSL